MSGPEGKRNRFANVRNKDYVGNETALASGESSVRGGTRVVHNRPQNLDTVNQQAEENTNENNGGLATNTGMASMTNNPNSMEINVSSAISVNEGDVSAGRPVHGTPLTVGLHYDF